MPLARDGLDAHGFSLGVVGTLGTHGIHGEADVEVHAGNYRAVQELGLEPERVPPHAGTRASVSVRADVKSEVLPTEGKRKVTGRVKGRTAAGRVDAREHGRFRRCGDIGDAIGAGIGCIHER